MDQNAFMDFVCKGRDCTKSTAKTHYYTVYSAYKLTGKKLNNRIPKTSSWVNKSLLDKLKDKFNDTKVRNTLSTLVVYLKLTKATKKKIKFFTDEMYTAAKTVRNKPPGKRSKKQENLWIGKQQLQEFHLDTLLEAKSLLRKKYFPPSSKRIVRDAIFVAVHTAMPPPRNDFATATLVKDPSDTHELDTLVWIKKSVWYGIFGKTRRSKGGMTKTKFPSEIGALIKKYIKKLQLKPGDRLFTSNTGKDLTNRTYGDHLKRVFQRRFGKRIGSSMLRVLYVSHKYKNLPKILADYEEDSRKMMHSSKTSKEHYLKSS